MNLVETKICSGKGSCGKTKRLDEFYSYKTRTRKILKHRRQCKDCYIKSGLQYGKERRKKNSLTKTRKCIGICGKVKLFSEFDRKCSICKECRGKGLLSQWISDIKNRSKVKGWKFDITTDFIQELFRNQNGKCAITKIPFTFNRTKHHSTKGRKKDPFSPSLDRIDAGKGYTKNNVRLVCLVVNLALNEFGDKIFVQMCEEFVKNNSHTNRNTY